MLEDRERMRLNRRDETPPDPPPPSRLWLWILLTAIIGGLLYYFKP
jgi:hypothetical protein